MNNTTSVSVIIPLYNGEDVIERALDSIMNQTVSVDEIIIVNDGSTDNSLSVVNHYITTNNYTNICVFNKNNGGVSSARNEGIKQAKNEIIAFLDCDDEWVCDKVETQLKYINDCDVVLVGGNHFSENINKISLRKAKQVNNITLVDLLFKNYFQTSTVMTKRSIALSFGGFNLLQTHAEEGQFYYNLATKGRLVHINRQLVIYDGGNKSGFGHSGLSGNILAMERGELNNLYHAYKVLGVNFFVYLAATMFSLLKFTRRFAVVKLFSGFKHVG